ncbi:zinc finger protein 271-like isoform X2 [Ochlerotatus camptorhynchus]|uniref:zinc finger protein 271-like isoform X2 n=1 Tax=Ochlerotatus camptorhynchus TaxID=644619 RepID=UPI0031CE02BB
MFRLRRRLREQGRTVESSGFPRDESKESHYQEMRATYKLYQCVLCNDQRGYQESIYWRHVHEDHDGFFLRCLDCGANFRSEKRKTDHALSHCNTREQIEASDSTGSEMSTKYREQKSANRPEKSNFHKNNGDLTNVDYQFSEDPSIGNCDGGIVDNDTKEFKIEGEISQQMPTVSTDKKCSYCDKEFNDAIILARHIEYCHQPFTCDICGMTAEKRNQIRYHKLITHTEPSYKCSGCPMVFHFNSAYQRHLTKHEKEKKVPCALCGNKFKSKPGLAWHMKRFHNLSQATAELDTDCNEQEQENGKELLADNILPKKEITVTETSFQLVVHDVCPAVDDKPLQVDEKIHQPSEESSFVTDEKQSCESLKVSQIKQDIPDGTSNIKCTYCPKECHDKKDLSRHYIYCHKPTECKICKKTFNGTSTYRYHKLITHTEPRHKCPHCQQSFHQKIGYRRHLSVHQKQRETPCDLCELKFKNLDHVKLHKKRVHSAKKMEEKKIPCERSSPLTGCPLCGDNFDDEHLLSQHVGTVHQMTVCTCCGMTFTSTRQLKNHKQKHHSIPKYNCNQCHQAFNTRNFFYKHMAAHDKESKLHCTICTLQFEDRPALQSHMAIDHNIVPERVVPQCTCSICGVTIAGRIRLRYHMLKCHTEPKFPCSHCPRKFVTKGNYLNHLQSHKSLRKFPCNFCNLKYKRMHHLIAHIESRHGSDQSVHVLQVHQDKSQSKTCHEESLVACEGIDIKHEILVDATPITPASSSATECSQCHMMFSNANELQDHLRVSHRSIECLICGLSFASAARLRNHKLLSHTKPRLKCSHCPKMFHYHYSLELHETRHNKIKDNKPIQSLTELRQRPKPIRTPKTGFVCKFCNKTYLDEFRLERHIFYNHRSSAIQCELCDLKFPSRAKWYYHKIKTHTVPRFKCPQCGMMFHVQHRLRKHLAVHTKVPKHARKSSTEEKD